VIAINCRPGLQEHDMECTQVWKTTITYVDSMYGIFTALYQWNPDRGTIAQHHCAILQERSPQVLRAHFLLMNE